MTAAVQPLLSAKVSSGPVAPAYVKPGAAEEFEAFVLQTFIQEMLPQNADNVFGSGIAGDIWRSMLSEKLAYEAAGRGDIGIAQAIRGSAGSSRAAIEAMRASSQVSALAASLPAPEPTAADSAIGDGERQSSGPVAMVTGS
jgi:Rod binding domain-containing protein